MSLIKKLGTGLALAGAVVSSFGGSEALAQEAEEVSGNLPKEEQRELVVGPLKFEYVPAVEPDVPQEVREKALPFSVFAQTGIHSKYRVDGGFTLSEGAVSQNLLDISFADALGEDTTLGFYTWNNFDFNTNGLSEIDLAGYVNFPIAERFMGGKLGGALELALWDYVDKSIAPNHDVGLMGRLNYSGPVDFTFELTQMLTSGQGREYDLIVSKTFDLGNIAGFGLAVKPEVSLSYLENFFGVDGLSNIQYGASLGATKGNFSIEGYVEQQESFKDDFESGPVFGVRASIGF